MAQAPFFSCCAGFRIVPRRAVKPGTIFVDTRYELGGRERRSMGTGLKRKIVPGGWEQFFSGVRGCGVAHRNPGFALGGNWYPLVVLPRDENVVPSQHTGNQNIPQCQQTGAQKTPHRRGLKVLAGGE